MANGFDLSTRKIEQVVKNLLSGVYNESKAMQLIDLIIPKDKAGLTLSDWMERTRQKKD